MRHVHSTALSAGSDGGGGRRRRRTTLVVGAALGVLAAVGLAAPAQASGWSHHPVRTAEVSVFHGVPKTPVDVYVDHKRVLNDFQPGTFAGPLKVKAGTYVVDITAATIIGPVSLKFAPGGNYTIAAHLTASGAPTATLYRNDLAPTPRGDGRLIVRHDAAAPAVDILAGGAPVVKSLTNPHEAKLSVPAGTVQAAVALAGSTVPVIGPAAVTLKTHTDTIVYAWGSAADGTLALAVQTVAVSKHCWRW